MAITEPRRARRASPWIKKPRHAYGCKKPVTAERRRVKRWRSVRWLRTTGRSDRRHRSRGCDRSHGSHGFDRSAQRLPNTGAHHSERCRSQWADLHQRRRSAGATAAAFRFLPTSGKKSPARPTPARFAVPKSHRRRSAQGASTAGRVEKRTSELRKRLQGIPAAVSVVGHEGGKLQSPDETHFFSPTPGGPSFIGARRAWVTSYSFPPPSPCGCRERSLAQRQ